MKVAVTVVSPAVLAGSTAVALPSASTGTRTGSPPALNSMSPSAPAGVTAALAWTVPPARTSTLSSERSVRVASLWMLTVPVREEVRHWAVLVGV